jgi:NAD-dependent SIR2 family protein deacetylase
VQGLPEEFHSAIAADKEHVDLLIVIGSSLKVKTTKVLFFGFGFCRHKLFRIRFWLDLNF